MFVRVARPPIFDSAMFRSIFSSKILSESGIPYDSHSGSTDFSFSFNFAACTNSATTLDYDKHIVDLSLIHI